jgi:hypothetical protein
LLFENQISNSVVGLSVFHNTTIGLSNNIISNNIRHGVVIRYDANVDFITGNEIKNNGGTGLLMPEYCGETHFTREELVQNNNISENHTAVELYPKRPRYEMIYRTGDSKETISENCKSAVSRGICPFAATHLNYTKQTGYSCRTCDVTDHASVCVVCVKKCHAGHDVSLAATESNFYCDCGAGCRCEALNVIK